VSLHRSVVSASQQQARRAFGSSAPASSKKGDEQGPKTPGERLKDFLLFRADAPSWAVFPRKAAAGEGYRFPSPASRPEPNIPTVEKEEDLYNTQYYTRDTKRNQPVPRLVMDEPPKELPAEAPVEVCFYAFLSKFSITHFPI